MIHREEYYEVIMSIKIVMLKSLEDVIAEVKEVFSGDKVVRYILVNPFTLTFREEAQVKFYPYAPLSSDKDISIPSDWVVSVVEPVEEIKNSYLENINGKSESTDS